MKFSELERDAIASVASSIDEFHYDYRKHISQSKYVFEVKPDQTWYDWDKEEADSPVPENLVGMWMMEYARNLEYTPFQECLIEDTWVRCKEVKVTTYRYEAIDGGI